MKLLRAILILVVFLLPLSVSADMGDMGTDDLGSPDVGLPDSGFPDSGFPDAGFPDAGFPDAGFSDTGFPDAASDLGTTDMATAPDSGAKLPDVAVTANFSGVVTLQGSQSAGDVLVSLTMGTDEVSQLTDQAGRFSFVGIEPGVWDVSVEADGWVTVEDTIDLSTGRALRDYRLFIDRTGTLRLLATLEGEPAPVTFLLESERERLEEEVSPEGELAELTQELGVATWTVSASADGHETVSRDVVMSLDRDDATYDVVLVLPMQRQSDIFVDTTCTCDVAAPRRSPLGVILLAVGMIVFAVRRRPRVVSPEEG